MCAYVCVGVCVRVCMCLFVNIFLAELMHPIWHDFAKWVCTLAQTPVKLMNFCKRSRSRCHYLLFLHISVFYYECKIGMMLYYASGMMTSSRPMLSEKKYSFLKYYSTHNLQNTYVPKKKSKNKMKYNIILKN